MISFNSITPSDIEIIVALMQDFYAIDNYPIDIDISKKLFREFIADDNLGKAWLIFENERVVGYVILTFVFSFEYKGKIAFLDELYLKEETRGNGIGKTTINFIQAEAEKMNLKLIYLEVENHNKKAQKLYLASDFKMHNRQMMKYSVK